MTRFAGAALVLVALLVPAQLAAAAPSPIGTLHPKTCATLFQYVQVIVEASRGTMGTLTVHLSCGADAKYDDCPAAPLDLVNAQVKGAIVIAADPTTCLDGARPTLSGVASADPLIRTALIPLTLQNIILSGAGGRSPAVESRSTTLTLINVDFEGFTQSTNPTVALGASAVFVRSGALKWAGGAVSDCAGGTAPVVFATAPADGVKEASTSSLEVTGVTFAGNSGGFAGALYVEKKSTKTLKAKLAASTFEANNGSYSGAVAVLKNDQKDSGAAGGATTLDLTNTAFHYNGGGSGHVLVGKAVPRDPAKPLKFKPTILKGLPASLVPGTAPAADEDFVYDSPA